MNAPRGEGRIALPIGYLNGCTECEPAPFQLKRGAVPDPFEPL